MTSTLLKEGLEKRLATLKGRYDSEQMSAIEYITGVSHNLAERKNI